MVGVSEREQKVAQDICSMLSVQLAIRPMELVYVQVFNATAEDSSDTSSRQVQTIQN